VQLSSPTVSGILDRLERAGLVLRERGSSDRRKVWLRLTEAGTAKLRDTPAPLQDRFVRRVNELPEERKRALSESLATLVSFLEAEAIDASPFLVAENEMKKEGEQTPK
jgi:DNA-binding MarR family transcriptional regulator